MQRDCKTSGNKNKSLHQVFLESIPAIPQILTCTLLLTEVNGALLVTQTFPCYVLGVNPSLSTGKQG